jgi:serine/threonine protein kinase
MKPELAARPEIRERFLREARAMAAVEHECIVPVYQADEVSVGREVVPYLAMPLLRGETLAARLRHQEPLPLAEVLRIGRRVAEGLAAAHAAGLIHRDIKPANIFLASGGGVSGEGSKDPPLTAHHSPLTKVKVLDFGLARAAEADSKLSVSGMVVGTPAYMAPEQANAQTVDARADLFSLGCVLYELATGKQAFTGVSTLQVLCQVVSSEPPRPREVNPQMPAGLATLIEELLAKDPARRPPSARAVADRLA